MKTRIDEFRRMQAGRASAGELSPESPSPENPAPGTPPPDGTSAGKVQPDGKPSGSLIETALFLEDAFGITLEEEEIDEQHIGPGADLSSFVLRKLRGD